MIIKRVVMKDFFRYYGTQKINCEIDEEKNVVVIIGENGRGKTTLLSAFNWVFYNQLIEPLNISNILNYRRVKELNIGQKADSYVSITFQEDSKEYKLKRTVEFEKDYKGNLNLIKNTSKLELVRIELNGDEISLDPKIYIEKLLIPKDLSGFFFFNGEHISRLAKVDGKKEIKKAILNVLGISYLDQSNIDLKEIKKSLTDKRRRIDNASPNEISLIMNHTKLESEVNKLEKELDSMEGTLKDANGYLNDLTAIINNSDNNLVKELEMRNNLLIKNKQDSGRELIVKEKNIKKHITTNFKYYLLYKIINDVEKILDQKKKDGQLPSNIKETFIEDIIMKGICICGTCLEEGTKEYDMVIGLKEQAGSMALDDAYYDLKSLLSKIKSQHKTFYNELNSMIVDREIIQNNIYSYSEELKIVSKKLQSIDLEEIKGSEEAREILRVEIEEMLKKQGILEEKLKEKTEQLISLEKAFQVTQTNNSEIEKIKVRIKIVEELLNLNMEFKEIFTEVVREELDLRIKEVFSQITNKEYRVPVLTKDFELKITSRLKEIDILDSEKKEEVLSTGEEQITSLSFIGALVSYAKNNKEDKILSKFTGDDYPIVMDSPFGNLDERHTKNVAANIGKLASQVIIVVSKKQWEGHVEENIKDQVIRTFKIVDGEDILNTGEYTRIELEEF